MSVKKAHVPVRTCLGCRRRERQDSFLRLALLPDGRLSSDQERRLGGRGGYLHRDPACWEAFRAAKPPFVRSLGRTVARAERERIVEMLKRQAGFGTG